MTRHGELGLFPLTMALLPGEVIPLHIFEERYKLLFNELMDGGEFGAVLVEKEGLRECGCSARIAELVERLDDGRMNVLVQGDRRFRLKEIKQPDEDLEGHYMTAVVEFFDDDVPEAAPELAAAALEAFRKVLLLMDVADTREPTSEGPLSFRLAAAIDFGTPLKQELLESVSERHRLQTLLDVLEALIPRLELRKRRESAIRGNGKGY
jgi:Lon protease-like protein